VCEEYLTHLEGLDAQSVIAGVFVLLDVSSGLESGEQPEDVVLVQLEPLGELRNAEVVF